MSQILGFQKRKFIFLSIGIIEKQMIGVVIKNLIELIGMTPARTGRIDEYPYLGGGGEGYTGFFPLMESYVIVDTYIELNQTEILLSTCKPDRMSISTIIEFLDKAVGPTSCVGTL